MEQKILYVVLTIVALAAGIVIGIVYQMNIGEQRTDDSLTLLNSPLILPPFAQGTVESIEERKVVLVQGEEKITITVGDQATVYLVTPGTTENPTPSQTRVEFDQLKTGNSVEIGLRPSPDGELQGYIVFVYPPQADQTPQEGQNEQQNQQQGQQQN